MFAHLQQMEQHQSMELMELEELEELEESYFLAVVKESIIIKLNKNAFVQAMLHILMENNAYHAFCLYISIKILTNVKIAQMVKLMIL